jgi:hypothetical protein
VAPAPVEIFRLEFHRAKGAQVLGSQPRELV